MTQSLRETIKQGLTEATKAQDKEETRYAASFSALIL